MTKGAFTVAIEWTGEPMAVFPTVVLKQDDAVLARMTQSEAATVGRKLIDEVIGPTHPVEPERCQMAVERWHGRRTGCGGTAYGVRQFGYHSFCGVHYRAIITSQARWLYDDATPGELTDAVEAIDMRLGQIISDIHNGEFLGAPNVVALHHRDRLIEAINKLDDRETRDALTRIWGTEE